MPTCDRFIAKKGRQCGRAACVGRTKCASHGGKSGRPPIHGKYSQDRKPMELVRASASDFDFLDDLHLLRRYRDDLVARLDENDAPALRSRVLTYLREDEPRVEEAIELLERGVAWDQTMRKVVEMAERSAALKVKGQDLLLRGEVSLPAAKVMLLFQQFIRIVREVTGDPKVTRTVLARAYREVLGAEPRIALLVPEGESAATVEIAPELPAQTASQTASQTGSEDPDLP